MVAWTLAIAVLVGAGITAGVMMAVALSIVPAFAALAPERYVETHKLVGRYFDRLMPPLVLTTIVTAVTGAVLAPASASRVLFAAAAVFLGGVSAVSQLGNVPINRRVKALAAGPVPAGWHDPRAAWGRLHLIRTSFAVLALCTAATTAVSLR
ncbi:MAG TPA: DUF1772 domain-containing protein [Rugosimonospora sp.]|nr:DUF1772 domain-containing protein [Rugosimonospora sp.]